MSKSGSGYKRWCKTLPNFEGREYWKIEGEEVPRPTPEETETFLVSRAVPYRVSESTFLQIFDEELEASEVEAPVSATISTNMRMDKPHRDDYADATIRHDSEGPTIIEFHPIILRSDEEYVRKVVRHELSHLRTYLKRKK